MADKVTLKNTGLFTNTNSLGSVPEGGMLVADNIVIDKDNIVEIRRGFKTFGNAIGNSAAVQAKQLFNYKNRLLRHYEPTSVTGYLEYQTADGGETFEKYKARKYIYADTVTSVGTTATFSSSTKHGLTTGDLVTIEHSSISDYNGTFLVLAIVNEYDFQYTIAGSSVGTDTDAVLVEATYSNARQTDEDLRIKSVEANKNLYFTTELGVKKIDAVNSLVVDSGVPKALDISLELYNESGFLIEGGQVGYRVLWGYKDANENLILGAASSRAFIGLDGNILYIADFNNILEMLDANGGLETNYLTLWELPSNATISEYSTNMIGVATKLDNDPGVTDTNYLSGLPHNPITTLAQAQEDLDYLVDKLNSDVGVAQSDFPNARTSQQVNLTISVPKNITPDFFYQIYRTSESVGLDVIPQEDYQLVYESNPTITQLAQGFLSVIDITPDDFRGAALYQNPTQEGDAQANEQPPHAKDLALYNNIMFYSNTKTKQTLTFDLVGLDPLNPEPAGSWLTFSNDVNSFTIMFSDTAEDAANGIALLDKDVNKTVAQQVDSTARSIVRTINRFTDNIFVSAYYISTPNGVPGKMLIEALNVSGSQFRVQATDSTIVVGGNVVSAYSPELIDEEFSDNEVKPNRVYYSKANEPEAVPLLNFFNVGGGDNQIHRISSLRDGVFVFSDEGIFKVVGDIPAALSLTAFDNTSIITSADSLVRGNNQIFFYSDQGICTVSDSGVNIISRYIEDKLLNLLDPEYVGFKQSTFGVFYQTDRKYIVFTVTAKEDLVATQAFVYNVLTGSWVRWPISKTTGIVSTFDSKLYFGAADINYLEQERKRFEYTDHADREYEKTVLTNSRIITNILPAEGIVILTAANHGLSSSDLINITGSDSSPAIDGDYQVTVIDLDTFYIEPTGIVSSGTSGRWVPLETAIPNFQTLELDTVANVDVGDVLLQELESTVNAHVYSYELESVIVEVDTVNNLVKLQNNLNFETGDCTIFDYIPVEVQWAPAHAGDASVLKQFREVHLQFDQFRGSDVKVICASDIEKNPESVDFELNEFGNWGAFAWGTQPWGGQPLVKIIRTYVPRGKQRCTLLNVTFKHEAAREKFRLEAMVVYYRAIKLGERNVK